MQISTLGTRSSHIAVPYWVPYCRKFLPYWAPYWNPLIPYGTKSPILFCQYGTHKVPILWRQFGFNMGRFAFWRSHIAPQYGYKMGSSHHNMVAKWEIPHPHIATIWWRVIHDPQYGMLTYCPTFNMAWYHMVNWLFMTVWDVNIWCTYCLLRSHIGPHIVDNFSHIGHRIETRSRNVPILRRQFGCNTGRFALLRSHIAAIWLHNGNN
jgi:hypothetical protein